MRANPKAGMIIHHKGVATNYCAAAFGAVLIGILAAGAIAPGGEVMGIVAEGMEALGA